MPRLANAMPSHCKPLGQPGTANTMPISAQNTISWMTLGLVNALYCRNSAAEIMLNEPKSVCKVLTGKGMLKSRIAGVQNFSIGTQG
jgi:hypothetical protein